jgi:hypothetical protein
MFGMGAVVAAATSACVANAQADQTDNLRPVALNSFVGEAGYVGATSFFQRAPISQHASLYEEINEDLDGYRLVVLKDFRRGLLIGVVQSAGRGNVGRDLEFVTTDKNTSEAPWERNSAGLIETRSTVRSVMAPISADTYASLVSSIDLEQLATFVNPRESRDPPHPCIHPPHVYFEAYVGGKETIAFRRGCDPDFEDFVEALSPFFDQALATAPSSAELSIYARELFDSARRSKQN